MFWRLFKWTTSVERDGNMWRVRTSRHYVAVWRTLWRDGLLVALDYLVFVVLLNRSGYFTQLEAVEAE